MGYSPWGHKELDLTKRLTLLHQLQGDPGIHSGHWVPLSRAMSQAVASELQSACHQLVDFAATQGPW